MLKDSKQVTKTAEVKPATEKKETVKAVEVKAAPEKKVVKKPAEKKAPAAKKAPIQENNEVFVQFGGKEWNTAQLTAQAKEDFAAQGHRASSIKKLTLYVKPEENKAYYVVNDKTSGSIDL